MESNRTRIYVNHQEGQNMTKNDSKLSSTSYERSKSLLTWSDLTFGWNELTWCNLTIEQRDRNSLNSLFNFL